MTTRVLVTGAGGPSAVSFMNAVRSRDVELFAGDIDVYAAGLYLVPAANRLLLEKGAHHNFVDDLFARCIEHHIDVLVPTVDFELLPLARRRNEFEAAGIRMLLADERTFTACLDKWVLVTTCTGVCPVPRAQILDESFDPSAWSSKFLVKPRFGAGGRGVQIVPGGERPTGPYDGSMVVQEFLPGAEWSVDVLCTPDAEVLAAVPRSRLKIDSGIAVAGRTVRDDRLEELGAAVATHLGIKYVANIQFREDAHGVPKLIDVNARFPGTMPLTVASGIDMPSLALDMVLGNAVEKPARFREVALVRTWQEHIVPLEELAAMEAAGKARG